MWTEDTEEGEESICAVIGSEALHSEFTVNSMASDADSHLLAQSPDHADRGEEEMFSSSHRCSYTPNRGDEREGGIFILHRVLNNIGIGVEKRVL